jgi:hypothetical protein
MYTLEGNVAVGQFDRCAVTRPRAGGDFARRNGAAGRQDRAPSRADLEAPLRARVLIR